MTLASDVVLDQERHFVRKANLDRLRQTGSLAEVDKVLEREGESDRLGQLNLDIFFGLLDIGVASESHRAVTDIAIACELDTVFGGLNHNC